MKKEFDLNLISAPQFSLTLPSSGQKIKVRSLLMKEYKNLFIARESDNFSDTAEQLVNSAVQSEVDIFSLPVGDVEYIFLQLYMASTGNNNIPVRFKCTNEVEEQECGEILTPVIDIGSAYVPKADVDTLIKVNDQVTIEMRIPSLPDFDEHDVSTESGLLSCVIACIDKVYVGEEAYDRSEIEDKLSDLMDKLTGKSFAKMVSVVNGTPRITALLDVKCPKCGCEHMVPITGIADFFI